MNSLFDRFHVVGHFILLYALGAFFIFSGALKFTAHEAEGIRPLVESSPFLFWLYIPFSVQAASNLIGVIEITIGALLLARRLAPVLAAYAGLVAAGSLVVTISFLFTTPGLPEDAQGFLLKDVFLLGIALWSAADAWRARRT